MSLIVSWLAVSAAALVVAGSAAVTGPASAAVAPPARSVPADARSMFAALNAIRRAHGLGPFRLSAQLSRAAVAHARSMGRKGYFDHDSADGTSFAARIAHYYANANRVRLGENILSASGAVDPALMIRAWMASPDHRANILDPAFLEIGIGVVTESAAPGVYGGHDVRIAVTDFAG